MQRVRVLWKDKVLAVVEKPAGLPVHPPELPGALRSRGPDLIRVLRAQWGQWIYPVHRLDQATAGVMVVALDSQTAGRLQSQFQSGQIEKAYLALCRGWVPESGVERTPLASERDPKIMKEAETQYDCLHRFELPVPGAQHPTSRFSLVRAVPRTGRWHQIRRHMKRISHPVIGDSVRGDGWSNRIWREITGDQRLYLLAWRLGFQHPDTLERLTFHSRFSGAWHRVFDRAGLCPWVPAEINKPR